jgi:hypothetical protein
VLQKKINFYENPAISEALVVFLKKIFCIERSVFKDPVTGQSKELDQSIEIAIFISIFLQNKK